MAQPQAGLPTRSALKASANPPVRPNGAPWIQVATDNQGLILRIKAGLATTTTFAGAGLLAAGNL